jgi:hypothetical protein
MVPITAPDGWPSEEGYGASGALLGEVEREDFLAVGDRFRMPEGMLVGPLCVPSTPTTTAARQHM